MLNDELPIVIDLPEKQDVKIRPLGDLHVGSKYFSEEMWQKWKESMTPDTKIVIVGDLMDNGIKSSVTSIYSETMMPSAQKEWLVRELEPFTDNILCAVGGNHERRTNKEVDDDPLYSVLCRLKREEVYRSGACFVMLRIGGADRKVRCNYRPSYNIAVLHGAGGGMYIGGSANRSERFAMAIEGMDLLITGHTHKPITFPAARLVFNNQNKQMCRKQLTIVTCSSMMEYGGYPLEKMMTPTALAYQEITLSSNGKSIKVTQEY